jgi:flagellar basal-body rod protein FlgB
MAAPGTRLARAPDVDKISDSAIITALGRQMNRAVARETIAASNLANLETPGYRAQELDFDAALERELGGSIRLAATAPGHQPIGGEGGARAREAGGLTTRRDGNNVQLDRELLSLTKAAGEFNAAQTALAAKFRLVRYAINEGR